MPLNNHLIVAASLALAALGVGFFARGIVGLARWLRGHDEVSLGTIFASNIYNGLLFVGSTAVISPVAVDRWGATVALAVGILAVALTFP